MMMMKAAFICLTAAITPVFLYAVDGQVLINQATVNATGGFPYVISQPGSYKLSGNLVVPDINTTAIRIATDFVTIDLGGFSIIGPNNCAGGTCPRGPGSGIETLQGKVYFNITIRNGTIQGMGLSGISLYGDSIMVEYVHARSNGFDGIFLARFDLSGTPGVLTTVQYCDAELNSSGITAEEGRISHSNASRNRFSGIRIDRGAVDYNIVSGNAIFGLFGSPAYVGNVFRNNGADDIEPGTFAPVNLGQNLCGSTLCP